ncbi:hypothetical protein [Longimicrobium sp.]|uniref:hypothetical protein n=1 Tax=Longimicrobium sp. TaxID=2029185 RepID=UPI003B3B47D7
MAKLMLELDALKVESFGTSPAAAAVRGTVYGQAATGTKPSCVSCYAPTDPCICDPIRVLTEEC